MTAQSKDGGYCGRGARIIAQLCSAEVFLLAVVEVSAETGTLEGGFVSPITDQVEIYNKILGEGVGGPRPWASRQRRG
jgi:hypothetical protein